MTKAEIEKRMNEIQQELDSLKAQLNEPEKKTGWEQPVCPEKYYFVTDCCETGWDLWGGCNYEETHYKHANCFTSQELAENIARYQSLDLRIRRRIAEICKPINHKSLWWSIEYNITKKYVFPACHDNHVSAGWECDTSVHADQIIEEFKDDLLWYFTEFKGRMDG